MTVLAYVAALGFDISLLRLIPAYRAQGQLGLARGVLWYAQTRSATVGLLFATIGVGAVWMVDFPPVETKAFLIGLPLIPVWALLWIRSSAVRAFGGVVSALVPDRVVRDGLLVVMLGLAACLQVRIDAISAVSMTLASSLVGLASVTYALRRLRPSDVYTAQLQSAASLWWRAAIPMVMLSLGDTALNRVGVVLLGLQGLTREAGIFALAFTIAAAVLLPRTAINTLFAPIVSDLFSRRKQEALQFVVTRTALWTLLLGLAVALPIAVLARPLMSWFGADFTQGATALRILLLGQVIAAGAGPQMHLLAMTGQERASAALLLCSVAINAVGTLLLVGPLGINGAAVAMTAALIGFNAAMAVVVWRKLDLVPACLALLPVCSRRPAPVTPPG
jgi:O-antigen/teichoic acid export membrane protein